MSYRKSLKWVARLILLLLSFCGIATLISNAMSNLNLSANTIEVAWVFGIGGPIVFIASLIMGKGKKRGRGI